MFLVPETSNIKLLKEGTLPERLWVEAVTYGTDMANFHEGFACRLFLCPPPLDAPSAYFAVKVPENPLDEPNMMYEDILVTSTTGVTLAFKLENKNACYKMAAVAEAQDVVVRFKIRVLVNREELRRGDLLTRPDEDKRGCAEKKTKTAERITPGQLLKKQKNG